ncbi:MAG: hypothetical protein Q4D04_14500, partial [Clostridia bacterium]|nr:hypothetical protein [Clostridia bacterium]
KLRDRGVNLLGLMTLPQRAGEVRARRLVISGFAADRRPDRSPPPAIIDGIRATNAPDIFFNFKNYNTHFIIAIMRDNTVE